MTKLEILDYLKDINVMYNNPNMLDSLSNMIDELLKERQWISVKDRLPENSGDVLCYHKGIYDVYHFSKRWQMFNAFDMLKKADKAIDVTHWMPLPEPQKEDEE